jgi:hypothetical protein
MDPLKKITELKSERDALKKALTQPGISVAKEIAIRNQVIAVHNEITALISRIAPDKKTVKFLDEDGEEQERRIDRATFNLWLSDISSLVEIAPGSSATQIATFDDVDEATLYRLQKYPIDVKACIQHLIDKHELEFGKACEELVRVEFPRFKVVKTTVGSKTGKKPPANPYAFRLDSNVKVDFYAKNGKDAVAGMFQLTMPREKKIRSFFNHCEKLHPPATKFILGVSLANPVALEGLQKRLLQKQHLQKQFNAVLVRSATGFCRL